MAPSAVGPLDVNVYGQPSGSPLLTDSPALAKDGLRYAPTVKTSSKVAKTRTQDVGEQNNEMEAVLIHL